MGPGDLLRLLNQASEMREKLAQAQERAARRRVEGEAGGGLVRVTVNGIGEVTAVALDPEALKDPESLGPLIAAAVNAGQKKSKEALLEELRGAMGGLNLPPGFPMV